MITIFGLFHLYLDAGSAVDALTEQTQIEEETINVLASRKSIDDRITLQLDTSDETRSDITAFGTDGVLDTMLSKASSVEIPDAGGVVASGDAAYTMVRRSTGLSIEDGSLTARFKEMLIPEKKSREFVDHIFNGGILIWVNASEEKEKECAELMLTNGAVTTYSCHYP